MAKKCITYRSSAEMPSEALLSLVETYTRLFSEAPWNEAWTPERVIEKLKHELSSPLAFLTLLTEDETGIVGGFCWGASIPVAAIPQRVKEARGQGTISVHEQHLNRIPKLIRASRILYIDELAIVREFRGGIAPVAALCLPFLTRADAQNLGVICWSTEESNIVPILRAYGFKTVAEVGPLQFFWASRRAVRQLKQIAKELSSKLS